MEKNVHALGALLLLMGLVCVLSSVPAWAAEETLSLPRVIEYSLHNNGDLKSFREEKGIVDAGTLRAGQFPNPTLELEAGTGAFGWNFAGVFTGR